MIEVDSSAIHAIDYDRQSGVLTVQFTSRETYAYEAVPPHVFDELRTAESVGRYFSEHIRDRYRYRRLTRN